MATSLASSMASLSLSAAPALVRSQQMTTPVTASVAPVRTQVSRHSARSAHSSFFGGASQLHQPSRVLAKQSSGRAARGLPVCMAAAEVEEEEAVEVSDEEKGAKAVLNRIRMSSTKVRKVVNQVRGRTYEDALMILEFMPYRACDPVLQAVTSAAANASHNMGFNKADLYISEAFVNQGPTLKRFRPRAQGRGYPIRKRTCSIEITVKSKSE